MSSLEEALPRPAVFRQLRQAAWHTVILLGLLLARLGLQAALYRLGFAALTADEFGRTVMAARFAQASEWAWGDAWLPFHMILIGGLLRFSWDLLLVPRLVSIFFGAVSVLLMANLADQLFESRRVGMVAALLLGLAPAHLWLSSAPLTEIIYFALVLAFLVAFLSFVQTDDRRLLYLSALILALANGFRYEAWMISLVFSAGTGGMEAARFWRGRSGRDRLWGSLLASGLPWLFPLAWIVGGFLASGRILSVLADVKAYKQAWYGAGAHLANDLRPLFELDPFLLVLGLAGCTVFAYRRRAGWWWYAAFTFIPLVLFLYLHGGQVEPEGNPVRYLAPYLFLFCPPAAFALDAALGKMVRSQTSRNLALAGILLLLALVQIERAFAYTNSISTRGLAVGQRLRSLRAAEPGASGQRAMVELVYWDYLAVHVGANDLDHIVYDRPLDLENRRSSSILQADLAGFIRCLAEHQFGYVIVRSPELRSITETVVGTLPVDEVNGYAFYPVPEALIRGPSGPATCPLDIGRGY